MATTTGGAALAERPTEDSVWLSPLPTPRHAVASDTLPAVRSAAYLQRVTRLAEGLLTGLPGAVTDLGVSWDGRHLVAAHYGANAASVVDTATLTTSSTVSGIAEAGDDIAFFVQAIVDGGGENGHVGMRTVQGGESFRAAHHADHRDAVGSRLLKLAQPLTGAAAGGEHGIEQEHVRSGEVRGQIGIVGMGQGGFLVPLDAHMRDAGIWNQRQDAIQQSQASA
jgi:hypothetical protein